MRKAHNIHIIIYIILILLLFKFLSSYIVNECFISRYNKGIYNANFIKYLSVANVYEPYVVHYNNGNRLYKIADYSEAIEEYKEALKLHPPKKKECSIRINLALAMIKNVENEKNSDVSDILEVLHDAKEVLYEDGCANVDNDEGHSKEAEQLEDDINEYEKLLKNQQEKSKEKDNNNDNNESEDDEQKRSELKKKEEQIKEQQKQSGKARQDDIEFSRDINNYKYYDGKQW